MKGIKHQLKNTVNNNNNDYYYYLNASGILSHNIGYFGMN